MEYQSLPTCMKILNCKIPWFIICPVVRCIFELKKKANCAHIAFNRYLDIGLYNIFDIYCK